MFKSTQIKSFLSGLTLALLLGWVFIQTDSSENNQASVIDSFSVAETENGEEEMEEKAEKEVIPEPTKETTKKSFGFNTGSPATDLQRKPAPRAGNFSFAQNSEPVTVPSPQVAGTSSRETAVETSPTTRRRGGSNSSGNTSTTVTESNGTTTATTSVETNVGTTTATSSPEENTGTTTSTSTETGGGTPAATSSPETPVNPVTEAQAQQLAEAKTCNPLEVLPLGDELFNFIPTTVLNDLTFTGSSTNEKGYEVRTCGNVSLIIKWEHNLPVQTLVLIEGTINPLSSGPFAALSGSAITDTILYSVAPGAGGVSLAANTFPDVLAAAITRSYGGSLTVSEGQHATAALTMEGLLKKVLVSMNYPTNNLTVVAGQATPPVSVQTGAGAAVGSTKKDTSFSEGLKPTYYIELTHRGTWSNAAGINDLALVDTTVYYDNGNNFGFWGVGTFRNKQFATFYTGPLVKSKDPQDYAAAQIGFGSESMSLPLYLDFVTAYNTRYANLAADATASADISDTTYAAVTASLAALPLDVVTVDHSILSSLVFNSGDSFPGLQYFNAAIVGPLGKTKDGTNGPQATLFGEGKFFKSTMGTLDFSMTASSAAATMTGGVGLSLGSAGGYDLGSLGGDATLTIAATDAAQSMLLGSSFAAGPFGGQSITIDFNPTQANFARAATCALPLGVSGYATIANAGSMSLSDLIFVPTVAIPDPTVLINCPEDIYFMAKDGVVLAFNGTVKLMEFADSFLPENEFTKIGIDGFKFAGGTLINAPEDLLELSRSVPGVGEALDAAADAKQALADAAAEAQRQAEEAARLAAEAAQAAVGAALNFTNDLLADPAGTLGSVFGAIGGAASDFFDGGDSGPAGFSDWINRTNNHLPAKAKDISLSHENVDWAWAVNLDGQALQFERGVGNAGYWWIRSSGLPGNYGGFVHIDADPAGGAVGITTKGEIYTRTRTGSWNKANGYAVDVGIGGGYIWITSTQPDGGGFRIYRAPYTSGQTNFAWQDMYGSGVRIDVGGDGDAWTVNNTYRVYENTAGGWHDRRGVALDIAVSKLGTAWIVGTNISHFGGQIHVYTTQGIGIAGPVAITPFWEPTAGHAIAIGAGAGPRVWAVNSFNDIYEASGRP